MPGAPETSLQFGWGHAKGGGIGDGQRGAGGNQSEHGPGRLWS